MHEFQSGAVHEYQCPSCCAGVLKLYGDLISKELVETKKLHSEEWFEVDFIKLGFSCVLRCVNCEENVFVVGEGRVIEACYDDESMPNGWGRDYIELFTPTFFQPPLQLINYASGTPEKVMFSLRNASALYFSNPSACCNNIRIAAEEVLNSLGVPESSSHNKRRLSFKDRIDLLPVKHQETIRLFDAIRWLGNHGSHPGDGIKKEHALQAFEIMEMLLEDLFSSRRSDVHALVLAITKAKGPI
ncbi:DUF4145 domain-containing protein [Pseudomonas protegens]|uniref:DUF4145 domain-containing protein n=1 Tax=Pseudomonas protegens TaxID=380021 RepID=UPI001B3120BE|nr:DUF4145 domain-containing protein [Pseudomonas protegens]MBP5119588.1 DUF4145 domain-containing protein [Pseudomonas protegens]QTU20659.1 DUF4145 domain-containing protein [Pseudomonas protegens]